MGVAPATHTYLACAVALEGNAAGEPRPTRNFDSLQDRVFFHQATQCVSLQASGALGVLRRKTLQLRQNL